MKFSSSKLSICFLIALLGFGIVSCDDPYKVGLELQTNNQLVNTFYIDTFSVDVKLVQQDKLLNTDAFNVSQNAFLDSRRMVAHVGFMQDPKFGTTKSSIYTNVFWGGVTNFDYERKVDNVDKVFKAIRIDSATIILTLDAVYGDSLTPMTFKVEQLVTALDTSKQYFSNQEFPTLRELGRVTTRPKFNINGTFQAIRIPLNTAFAEEFFDKRGKTELSNSTNFRNFIKGLKISVEGSTPASMITINMAGDSKIELAIAHQDATENRLFSFFFLTANPAAGNRNQWFSSIQSNFSATPFLSSLQPRTPLSTKNTDHRIYLQDGTGLVAWLDFPTLRNLNKQANSDDYMMLNRAELYFFTEGNVAPNQAPSELFFYESAVGGIDFRYYDPLLSAELDPSKRIAAQPIPVGRDFANNTLAPLTATYVPNGFTYSNTFFTRYLQSVIDGKDTLNGQGRGIFMSPAFLHTAVYQTSQQQFVKFHARLNKMIIFDNNAIHGEKRMKLKLYYTKFKR
jgi:hypothetical protein